MHCPRTVLFGLGRVLIQGKPCSVFPPEAMASLIVLLSGVLGGFLRERAALSVWRALGDRIVFPGESAALGDSPGKTRACLLRGFSIRGGQLSLGGSVQGREC
jgi:hypothetical protein